MSTLIVSGSDEIFISYLIQSHSLGAECVRFNDESGLDEILNNLNGSNLFGESKLILYKGSLKEKKIAEIFYKYNGERLILWLDKKPEKLLLERFLSKVEVKVYNEGEDSLNKILYLIQFFKLDFTTSDAKEINKVLGEDIARVYSFLYLVQGSGLESLDIDLLLWYKEGIMYNPDPWDIWVVFEKEGIDRAMELARGTDPLALVGYIAYLAKKDAGFGNGRYCEGAVWDSLIFLDRFAKFYKERAFALIFTKFQRVKCL